MRFTISFDDNANGKRGIFIRENDDHMDYVWLAEQICPVLDAIETASNDAPDEEMK